MKHLRFDTKEGADDYCEYLKQLDVRYDREVNEWGYHVVRFFVREFLQMRWEKQWIPMEWGFSN